MSLFYTFNINFFRLHEDQDNYYLNRIFVACKKTGLVLVDKLWSWPKLIMCDPNMASTLTARIGSYISGFYIVFVEISK
jgi:hypothetical protein